VNPNGYSLILLTTIKLLQNTLMTTVVTVRNKGVHEAHQPTSAELPK